jgi:hypothetical protein
VQRLGQMQEPKRPQQERELVQRQELEQPLERVRELVLLLSYRRLPRRRQR